MREQPERLELGQLAADRRGGDMQARPLDERLRADGLAGRHVLLDDAPQDLPLAGVSSIRRDGTRARPSWRRAPRRRGGRVGQRRRWRTPGALQLAGEQLGRDARRRANRPRCVRRDRLTLALARRALDEPELPPGASSAAAIETSLDRVRAEAARRAAGRASAARASRRRSSSCSTLAGRSQPRAARRRSAPARRVPPAHATDGRDGADAEAEVVAAVPVA